MVVLCNSLMINIFSSAYPKAECFLRWSVYLDFLPTFYRIVCFHIAKFSEFFIYSGCNLLSDTCFAKILPPSMACLFILLSVSFEGQKVLVVINSNLLIFLLIEYVLVSDLRILCLAQGHKDFLFSFRSFIILGFTFSCVIHFELIFIYGMSYGSNIFFTNVAIKLFQHQLLKTTTFLLWIAFAPLSKIFHIHVGLFLILFCSTGLCVFFMLKPHCFDYCTFRILEIRCCEPSDFVFVPICFDCRSSEFSYKF